MVVEEDSFVFEFCRSRFEPAEGMTRTRRSKNEPKFWKYEQEALCKSINEKKNYCDASSIGVGTIVLKLVNSSRTKIMTVTRSQRSRGNLRQRDEKRVRIEKEE